MSDAVTLDDAAPTYNHSREDGPATPCRECAAAAALVALVRDLAAVAPLVYGDDGACCALCGASAEADDDGVCAVDHADGCVWARAVALVAAEAGR